LIVRNKDSCMSNEKDYSLDNQLRDMGGSWRKCSEGFKKKEVAMFKDYVRVEKRSVIKYGSRMSRLLIIGIIVCVLCSAMAYGAEYPTKAIQIISPFPPGGGTDFTARALSKKVSIILGQKVIVVNKPGGMGIAGYQFVATAPSDGYKVIVAAPSVILAPLTVEGVPIKFKDFTPINIPVTLSVVLAVNKDAPWKTLQELISEAKKNPGKLSYASAGPNTLPHLAAKLFQLDTATSIKHLPMNGAARAIVTVLGRHADMILNAIGAQMTSHIEAGTLRALAVMSRKRLEVFPDIPTTIEMGYPKLIATNWYALLVRAGTSPAIIRKLGGAFHEALKDKEVISLFKKAGMPIKNLAPKEAIRFLGEEEKKFSKLVKMSEM
ncbi:tripartite tricarboxylate transporter substrate binding protein, partial [Thermodesulfobacteriota bacterium]